MSSIACPRCSAILEPIRVEDEDALACPAQHGLWFDQGQLDAVAEDDVDEHPAAAEDHAWAASDHDPDGLVTERWRNCPVCQITMQKDVYKYGSGVVIDTCPEHGNWVDAGEVEKVEAWNEAYRTRAGS